MTEGEQKLAGVAMVVGWLAITALIVGICFAGALYVLDQGLQLAHLGRSTKFARIGFWGCASAVGLVFGLYSLGSVILDAIKKHGWRAVLLPDFLWPTQSSATPSIVARTGRVLHWAFVTCAVVALLAGIWATVDQSQRAAQSRVAQEQWDRAHPVPGRPGFIYETITNDFGVTEYRPTIPDDEWIGLLIGAGAALCLGLFGRGVRYILAGE